MGAESDQADERARRRGLHVPHIPLPFGETLRDILKVKPEEETEAEKEDSEIEEEKG